MNTLCCAMLSHKLYHAQHHYVMLRLCYMLGMSMIHILPQLFFMCLESLSLPIFFLGITGHNVKHIDQSTNNEEKIYKQKYFSTYQFSSQYPCQGFCSQIMLGIAHVIPCNYNSNDDLCTSLVSLIQWVYLYVHFQCKKNVQT